MLENLRKRNKGITLIEILIALAALVILISFAVPSISGANTSMQMKAAAEEVEYSIDMARKTARMTEAPVTMNIITDDVSGRHRITFTVSERAQKRLSQPDLPQFELDSSLVFQSEYDAYEFDRHGLVTQPGTLTLSVKEDESKSTHFAVH